MDCAEDTKGDLYYVHDEVWLSVVENKTGMLCVLCLEARLNRTLTSSDFDSSYINRLDWGQKSDLLRSRLASVA